MTKQVSKYFVTGIFLLSGVLVSHGQANNSNSTPTSDYTNWTGTIDNSKLPKGLTTITNSTAEATFLAYQAGLAVADKIAADVCAVKPPSVILFNNVSDIDALRSLFIVRSQLKAFEVSKNGYYATIQLQQLPPVPGFTNPFGGVVGPVGATGAPLFTFTEAPATRAVVPILSAADAALSLISLFKKDVTINGVSISTDDLSLQLMVAGRMRTVTGCDFPVLQTAYSAPPLQQDAAGAGISNTSPLMTLILDALRQQNLLQTQSALFTAEAITPLTSAIAQLQKIAGDSTSSSLDADEAAAMKKPAGSAQDAALSAIKSKRAALAAIPIAQADLGVVQAQVAILTNVQGQVSALTTSLNASGSSAMQAAVKAEALNCALVGGAAGCADKESTPYVLITKMSAAGGDNQTRQSIFSTKIAFSGVITATYMLLDGNGSVSKGGMFQCYGAVNGGDMITTNMLRTNKVSCRSFALAGDISD